MKKIILIVGVLVFLASCNPPTRGQQTETANSENVVEQTDDLKENCPIV